MKIICVGRNYAEHAKELGNEKPETPVLFLKPKSALLPPGKDFYYPEFTDDLHYECELVVKISKNGKYIQEKFAHKYYSEISLGIDLTARDLQSKLKQKGLPWEIAKAFDGSAPVGTFRPLPADAAIQDLRFSLSVNGEEQQSGHTADMLFSVNQIIAYASRFFTLNIGDLIFTGTPAGVGPVQVLDHLEAFLEGEKLLDLKVR